MTVLDIVVSIASFFLLAVIIATALVLSFGGKNSVSVPQGAEPPSSSARKGAHVLHDKENDNVSSNR